MRKGYLLPGVRKVQERGGTCNTEKERERGTVASSRQDDEEEEGDDKVGFQKGTGG